MGIPHDAIALYPWSCKYGWCPAEGYRKQRSAPPYGVGPWGLGKTLLYLHDNNTDKFSHS